MVSWTSDGEKQTQRGYKKMKKLKVGLIGLGQRGAGYGFPDWAMGLLGNILQNSENVEVAALCDSDPDRIKAAVEMVKEGRCMGMFPQGHRYPQVDPRTTPTKNGAALICTRANAASI